METPTGRPRIMVCSKAKECKEKALLTITCPHKDPHEEKPICRVKINESCFLCNGICVAIDEEKTQKLMKQKIETLPVDHINDIFKKYV
jgi:hypothetical protein